MVAALLSADSVFISHNALIPDSKCKKVSPNAALFKNYKHLHVVMLSIAVKCFLLL